MKQQLQKLTVNTIILLASIIVLAYRVGKQLVLPKRGRAGNVFSSILTLFTGLTGIVSWFEKTIVHSTFIFRHKYVRQAFILAAGFLFLASSLEWSVGQVNASKPPQVSVVSLPNSQQKVCAENSFTCTQSPCICLVTTAADVVLSNYFSYGCWHKPPILPKKYIRYRVLRI